MTYSIPREFIDELLARVDIIDIIDPLVPLKKAGANHQARCPFHQEKSPSFTVSQRKQFYHCFGCGAHGNAISFLMNFEQLDFVSAIEKLAHIAGLPLPTAHSEQKADSTEPLYQLLHKIADHYHEALSRQPEVKSYLRDRGFTEGSILAFNVGFASNEWNQLEQCHPSEIRNLKTTGMITEKGHDRFRNRIMFPIRDRRGRTIAFGGRVLDDSQPKYLNSPETPIFHKGKGVFGLYEALKAKANLDNIIVVEGYLDVIALHQHGFTNTVATLGTAITAQHLQLLLRFSQNLIFCFDGDSAGRSAAWRALENALPMLHEGVNLRFCFLPETFDPDDMVRKQGAKALQAHLDQAITLSDYLFKHLAEGVDIRSGQGKAQMVTKLKPFLELMPKSLLRDLYIQELARKLSLKPEQILALPPLQMNKAAPQKINLSVSPVRMAITLFLQFPELALEIDTPIPNLEIKGIDVLKELITILKQQPRLNTGSILEHWRGTELENHLAQLASLLLPFTREGAKTELQDSLARIQALYRAQRVDELFSRANQEELSLEEKQELQQLLREK